MRSAYAKCVGDEYKPYVWLSSGFVGWPFRMATRRQVANKRHRAVLKAAYGRVSHTVCHGDVTS